jgi:hypothetical protein
MEETRKCWCSSTLTSGRQDLDLKTKQSYYNNRIYNESRGKNSQTDHWINVVTTKSWMQ